MDNTSGAGEYAAIPPEIDKWNWGAFLGGWYWTVAFGLPWATSWKAMIPFYGNILCGKRGNEWAWKHIGWIDVSHMLEAQHRFLRKMLIILLAIPAIIVIVLSYR